MQLHQIPGTHVARGVISAQGTAGTADTWAVFTAPHDLTVTAARWIPNAAVTGANTNNFALQVKNGSTGITDVKTYASGTDSVALTAETLTLSSTAADLQVDEGDVVHLARTVNGSGLASPDGTLEIEYEPR